jgi:hypothetical protein
MEYRDEWLKCRRAARRTDFATQTDPGAPRIVHRRLAGF